MSARISFISWLDETSRLSICRELGLPLGVTVNRKTVVENMTPELHDRLRELEDWDIIRLTLHN